MNKWNSKTIAFISILIAMSISFVIIGTRFAAISSFPSIKLSLAGLPIKIIGFTFGPIIGFITGFTTDVISFIYMPTFYHPLYSIALGISGMLPGLSAILFNNLYKKVSKDNVLKRINVNKILIYYKLRIALANNNSKKFENLEKKYSKLVIKSDKIKSWKNQRYQLNSGLISSIIALLIIAISLITMFVFIPQELIYESLQDNGILKYFSNKWIFITIVSLGIYICILILIIARFKMKESNFLQFVCIVVFVVYTEYVNIPIIAYGDEKTLKISFLVSAITSLATSIVKILFNLVVISFAIRIVLPLINKKVFNGYE